MISPNSSHGGGVSTPRCGASSRLTWALDAVLAFKDKLIVTDLQMVLDATLFTAFALFAALFFPPAALLVAARDRGSARSSRCRCHLGSLRTATATAVAVATVAFSHLGGCLLRHAAISS